LSETRQSGESYRPTFDTTGAEPGPPARPAPSYPSPAAREAPPRSAFSSPYGSDPRYKLPILAGMLSFIPGLGQVYLGLYLKGFTNAIVVAGLITFLANTRADEVIPFAALFMVFFWLYNVIDAFRQATLYNQALEGGRLDEPQVAPSFHGSIAGGVALVIVGTVLLLHTVFDLTLRWVEDWWPLPAILVDVYLIVRAVQERSARDRRAS
jgi:hypothetical protein